MTTNDDVLIREIDEELTQDRQLAAFKKYGPYAAVLAVAALVVVGVFQMREARRTAAGEEASEAYALALDEEVEAEALLDFAGTVPSEGYRGLALLRAAGTAARSGDRTVAINAYGRVYDDAAMPAELRDLARIRAGYLALEDSGEAATGIVASVTTPAFLPFAQEINGLAALGNGEYESAAATFSGVAGEESPIGARASSLLSLARTGAAGTPLEAIQSSDDFLGAFGDALRSGQLDQDPASSGAAEPTDGPTEGPDAGTSEDEVTD